MKVAADGSYWRTQTCVVTPYRTKVAPARANRHAPTQRALGGRASRGMDRADLSDRVIERLRLYFVPSHTLVWRRRANQQGPTGRGTPGRPRDCAWRRRNGDSASVCRRLSFRSSGTSSSTRNGRSTVSPPPTSSLQSSPASAPSTRRHCLLGRKQRTETAVQGTNEAWRQLPDAAVSLRPPPSSRECVSRLTIVRHGRGIR